MAHKLTSVLEYTAASEIYIKLRCTNRIQLIVSIYVIMLTFINFAIINVNKCIFVLSGFVFFVVISDCPPGKKTDDPQGRCCYFPFTYLGKTYHSCTTDDWHRPWCSFDAVYSGEWANCGKKTLIRLELEKLLLYMYYPVISTQKLLKRENGINTNCTLAMTMFILYIFFIK